MTLRSAAGSRPVPVRVSDFAIQDHLGARYSLSGVGRPAPAAVLAPGRSMTFSLRTRLPTGKGLVRWAPDGAHVAASWDFVVETD